MKKKYMTPRLFATLFLSLFAFCTPVTTQVRLPKPIEISDAMKQRDAAAVERLLRDYERADNAGFIRNNYDYLLGRALAWQGKDADAARVFEKIVARNGLLAGYALWRQAELARAAGRYAEEQKHLQRLLAEHPGWLRRERAAGRLGASYLKTGQYTQAIATLSPLGSARGSAARDTLARVGEAQLAAGQTAVARATYEQLLADGLQDDAALKAVLGLDRIDETARTTLAESDQLRRARICQFNRDFATARKHWLPVINDFPQSAARSEALFQMGRAYELEDKFAEAIAWYQKAGDEFPLKEDGEKGFYYVGHCHQYLGDATRAVARYEEFMRKFPRSSLIPYAHLNAIDTLRSAGRDAEALQWAARTQALPDAFAKVTGLFQQARIRVSQENWAAALADFDALRARNLNVRGLVATTNLPEVNFMRAYCLEQLGRYDEAIVAYLTMPETRNGATGYYGYRASQRMRALLANPRAKNAIGIRLQEFLTQARAAASPAANRKTAVEQALRLTGDVAVREEMLGILRGVYSNMSAYQGSHPALVPAGRTAPRDRNAPVPAASGSANHAALADELLFLSLYDEGAPELEAAGGPATASTFTMAYYYLRGDRADRAISLIEPTLNKAPDDYRVDLMPRLLAEMMYPAPYHYDLQRQAAPRRVEPSFVLSIMRQESRFNPTVKSPQAARGLLQFISATSSQIAAQLQFADFEQEDLYTPASAILIGSRYMQNLFAEFGDAQAVAAAYNGSEQSVRRWRARARSADPDRNVIEIGKRETKDYVYKVLGNLEAYRALYR
ncbi:MAG: transglycosylase SLT domain-containing protein [Blastocatellia bacterium]